MFGNSCQLYIGRDRVERINLLQDSMGSNPQPLAHEVGVKTTRHTLSLSLSLSIYPGIFNTNSFFTAKVVTRTRRNIKLHVHGSSCSNSFRRPEWNRSNAR